MKNYINVSLFEQKDSLKQFKHLLKQKDLELKLKFDPQQSVATLLKEKSDFIDLILNCCWQHFLGDHATQLSLCAVGGYGRRELFPHSDIDILVLLDSSDTAPYQEALSNLFTFLWDIGLKPGYSVRSIDECVSAALDDQSIMTSLLEISHIAGRTELYEALKLRITPNRIWPSDQFFAAKMEEQRLRHTKFHDTAYNLEPNIKEGPGGLRDMQCIAWVFKRHYNSSTLKELIKYDFLPEAEYNELIAARDILWRVRYALHLLTNRAEDRLIFDYQREIARQFGFIAEQPNQDVEQFMQFYFKTLLSIERLNEMLLQLFNERFITSDKANQTTIINDDFIAINGYLQATNPQLFEQRPLALLEVFLILQLNPTLQGIRATTIRLIRKNLALIDDSFRSNKSANQLFIELFRRTHGLTHELRRMNRYGVLAAYLPCFANIIARMQYDLFHIYTVDEHTLFVIRNLRRFSLESHNHEFPFCTSVFKLIAKPEIVYLAAFFHDIAKGQNGDHSKLGEDIARNFCQQHDLSSHDTNLIAWLVSTHLLMSVTAQRKDISDPDVIHEFAQKVGSVEYLNHLYLLTVADIRATNPELWNDWKDSLLKELYLATHSALRHGLQNPSALEDRLLENKQEAHEKLSKLGLNDDLINDAWQHTNDDYFLRYSADEIAWHTMAISSAKADDLPLVLLSPQTQHGSADVFIYAENIGPIFSISTATLDQLGLTILDARIMTTQNNYALNSFQVLEQSGEPINESCRALHICSALRQNLIEGEVKGHINIHRQSKSRQAQHFPIATNIKFIADPLNRYTLIELITTDHAGLLAKIGSAFIKQQVNLLNAKITTIGSRAEDMFYITDQHLQAITDPEQQAQIREEILTSLAED
ncbi:MAG: [protein-PII] uridylyltransferase [Methylococcales bacterium]|nr:MAG: [protein-PII] uridylyltransferase [Methylococcales bacterium]